MPKSQSLFSAVFGFRNPSKEIFSESDDQRPASYFSTKLPEHPGRTGGGPQGTQMIGRRGPGPGRAALWCHRLVAPPRLPFRLFKASVAKTLLRRTTIRKTFQSRRHREAKIWGTGISIPAPCRSGEVPPEGFSIDTAAISTAIFITAAAPMRRE